jgi:hypothetical protein
VAVIMQCQREGICADPSLPKTVPELLKLVASRMYEPAYPPESEYFLDDKQ